MEVSAGEQGGLHFRKMPGMQIDVNSFAQGYAVDVIADYLGARGVKNMMVELGGEVVARGLNASGKPGVSGLTSCIAGGRACAASRSATSRCCAGNERYLPQIYEKDGKKYSHTIDPATGYPVDHNLLSVTVKAPNCTNADALATAFLVMGVDATKEFLRKHPELKLEVYLIIDAGGEQLSTYSTAGWEEVIEEF
jgi:FAD:protein FMN transferase